MFTDETNASPSPDGTTVQTSVPREAREWGHAEIDGSDQALLDPENGGDTQAGQNAQQRTRNTRVEAGRQERDG
jgi:hypothetical protein